MKFDEFTAKDLDKLIERELPDDIDEEDPRYGEDGWYLFKHMDYERALKAEDGRYILDKNGYTQTDPKSLWGVYYPEIDSWVSTVDEYGGEGGGDNFWVVVRVVPNDPATNTPAHDWVTPRCFKKSGYYSSYDGGYLDGQCVEVRPVEKTVVVYE